MKSTPSLRTSLAHSRRGASLVEYALLCFLILAVAAVVWNKVGYKVGGAGADTAGSFTQG